MRSLGYKVTAALLYVTNGSATYNDVRIYQARAKDPAPLATISDGVNTPVGACIDRQGTLYVTNEPSSGPGWISEYPLGKTTPSKMIMDGVNEPGFCAIDAKGNLWVANIYGPNVTEYLFGARKPHAVITAGLVYPIGIAIDHSGSLYVGNGIWRFVRKTSRCTRPETNRHPGRSRIASPRPVASPSIQTERST